MSSTSTSKKPRAFVLTRNLRFDFRPLEAKYDLVYLSQHEREFNPLNISDTTSKLRERFSALRFDASRDMVVMAGPQMLVAILFTMLGYDYPRHLVLMFNARTSEYMERVNDLVEL